MGRPLYKSKKQISVRYSENTSGLLNFPYHSNICELQVDADARMISGRELINAVVHDSSLNEDAKSFRYFDGDIGIFLGLKPSMFVQLPADSLVKIQVKERRLAPTAGA